MQNNLILRMEFLLQSLEDKHPYTAHHCRRVRALSEKFGESLGINGSSLELLATSAHLHDIGKLLIPNEILNSTNVLSSKELAIVKRHPEYGSYLLTQFAFPASIITGVYEHHERLDGTGYPAGLKEGSISRFAKIISITDAYDAMTSGRSYQKAITSSAAIKLLVTNSNKAYDSQLVKEFTDLIKRIR